ncbi:Peptidyl-prolyl cis-trans isomerase-like 4 [Naganishia albida]|nr:Peptidyl-prolyl cis-trans isomerase-like 4 [Naganishia albida]
MSVLIETSVGDLVVDLEIDSCPRVCENFLKLCKIKYYGLNAFFNVSKDFIAQTGDPTATGKGGESFESAYFSRLPASEKRSRPPPSRYIAPEIKNSLKHTARGTVSMAVAPTGTSEKGGCGSQFFITLADNIEYLDGKHSVFGHVVEGFDVLDKLNDAYVDQEGRPLKDIRIRHIEILEDPFDDPTDLVEPPSPIRPPDDPSVKPRIGEDEEITTDLTEEEEEARKRAQEATASALTLEMIGDLPFANVRPPENILFVCKLNPVTTDEDLELIFSRFGKILSCEVIRDKKTGESLQYAFIEFDKQEDAEMAYFKMQNTLIDDRRIWVDFSQSVSKMGGAARYLTGGGAGSRGRGGRGGRGGMSSRPYERDSGYPARRGEYDLVFDKDDRPRDKGDSYVSSSRDRERRDGRDSRRDRSRSRDRHRERDGRRSEGRYERRRSRSRSPQDSRDRDRERRHRDRR